MGEKPAPRVEIFQINDVSTYPGNDKYGVREWNSDDRRAAAIGNRFHSFSSITRAILMMMAVFFATIVKNRALFNPAFSQNKRNRPGGS
jgi:hypothetical protein